MTPRPDPLDVFRSLPLFAQCTPAELAEIDSMADEVHVDAGRTLATQGEIGREFVVIVSGTAAVERDGSVVASLGPGDFFGELALLDDQPRNATVRAKSDLTAQVIDRRAFQALLEDSPHLTRNLLYAVATRLADRDAEVARLSHLLAASGQTSEPKRSN